MLIQLQKYYQVFARLNNGFFTKPSQLIIAILIVWNIEWLLLYTYISPSLNTPVLFNPNHLSFLAVISLIYWIFIWSNLNWRRTQFGYFSRGERKLWAKALAAFWVVEFVTIFSFVIIYFWLSWGPYTLIARKFKPMKSGLITEIILYTYIFYIAYILRITTKWNTYHMQLLGTMLVLILVGNLVWHDLLIILFRNNLTASTTAHWRHIRTSAVTFALSHEWWAQHILPSRSTFGWTTCFADLLNTNTAPEQIIPWSTLLYEQQQQLFTSPRAYNTTLIAHQTFQPIHLSTLHTIYPSRTGFIPKRFTMWQLLIFLKIWHHLLIVFWWNLMIYRLRSRQQTSFNWLYACTFNVYCCFFLAVLIYAVNTIPFLEVFFRYKKYTINNHKLLLITSKLYTFYEDNLFARTIDYKKTFLFLTHARS